MTKHANVTTSVSALMGVAVADADGRTVGHVREFAVAPQVDANHVLALVLRPMGMGRGDRQMAAVGDLELKNGAGLRLKAGAQTEPLPAEDSYLMLERDLLDQQIIDVHGHKVVRVNDVELVWEAGNGAGDAAEGDSHRHADGILRLRIAEVEVGTRGAVRRLLKGLPEGTVERVSGRFRTTRDPVGLCGPDRPRSCAAGEAEDRAGPAGEDASVGPGGHSGGAGAGGAAGAVHIAG